MSVKEKLRRSICDSNELRKQQHEQERRVNPDGGYGWVIVGICFMSTTVADGMIFTYGAFYSDLMDLYDGSVSNVMIGGFLLVGFANASGPLGAVLVNKFGFRTVMASGAILSTIAICGSSFINTLFWFNVVLGIIGGITQGLVLLVAYTMTPLWFTKKISIACSISYSGVGFGCMVYPVVIEYLINMYSIRGCLLILGAVNLNLLVFGALIKEPQYEVKRNSKESDFNNDIVHLSADIIKIESQTVLEYDQSLDLSKKIFSKTDQSDDEKLINTLPGDILDEKCNTSLTSVRSKTSEQEKLDDIFSSSINNRLYQTNQIKVEPNQLCCGRPILSSIKRLFQPELFRNISFWIIICSTFLLTIILFAIPQTMKNYIDVIGLSRTQSTTFSVTYGAMTIVAKIVVGVAVRYIKRSKTVYVISGLVLALSTSLVGVITDYYYILFYAVVLGFTGSSTIIMRYVITAEYIQRKYLTSAYGWTFLSQSMTLFVALIIAKVGTEYGNYSLSFIINGITALLGSSVLLLLLLVKPRL